ncbi:MAG: 50S ribosomal protein L30 [Bacteroidota bacterium]|nr:50S ribosomal protein L30 [Bacteroidota bacterium]
MTKLIVKQIRSSINRIGSQKKTLQSLGLGKIGKQVTHESNPTINGMIKKVSHLVEIKEVK